MSGLGVDYVVKTLPDVDESYPDSLQGGDIPEFIACKKAGAYRSILQPGELLITADTIVWLDGKVLGKPQGREGAVIPEFIACKKAGAYRSILQPGELLITADTIVWLDGKVLGKPQGREGAVEMLRALSGKKHQVFTGVCLTTTEWQKSFTAASDVLFDELSDEEIAYYVDRYQPMDKAGAYGVQEWIGTSRWTRLVPMVCRSGLVISVFIPFPAVSTTSWDCLFRSSIRC